MQVINGMLAKKLQEIVDLQTEIELQEKIYTSLLEVGESIEIINEILLKIKYLKVELKAKEDHAMTLFN